MATDELTLARYYSGWATYQKHLSRALPALTAEQLALRVAPSQRDIGTIAAHIVGARAWWFHTILGEGSPDLAALQGWDDVVPVAQTGTELAAGLDATWRLIADCLARWTPADLAVTRPHPRRGEVARGWVIWHVLEHDIHHGGELFLTAGMHDLPVPDL